MKRENAEITSSESQELSDHVLRRRLTVSRPVLMRVSLALVAFVGVAAALVALAGTDNDPIDVLLGAWPIVLLAGGLYATGMCVYAASWAALFDSTDNRLMVALSFLISQPVKYLPGGIAQPIGQITLGAQAVGSTRRVVVAFPVHVLINIVAAVTIGSIFVFVADVPSWTRWGIAVVPILWVSLDGRWMATLLSRLGRLHRIFRVTGDLPNQSHINRAFVIALLAHGTMFTSFGVLSASSIPGWSALELTFAYAIAWLIGYIAIPAPAGLGAREGVLAVLLSGSVTTLDIVRISAVHRIEMLVVEMLLLVIALVLTRSALRGGESPAARSTEVASEDP